MAEADPDYIRPAWACAVWYDAQQIYLEIPARPLPYITSFPFSESGLRKALDILKAQRKQSATRIGTNKPHPLVKRIENKGLAKKGLRPTFTVEQHEAVRNIIRKRGLI